MFLVVELKPNKGDVRIHQTREDKCFKAKPLKLVEIRILGKTKDGHNLIVHIKPMEKEQFKPLDSLVHLELSSFIREPVCICLGTFRSASTL